MSDSMHKKFHNFKLSIRDIYRDAVRYQLSQREIRVKTNSLFIDINAANIRQYHKFGLSCYKDALHDNLSAHLIYGHVIDDKFYSVDNTREDYYGSVWSAKEFMDLNLKGGLYWADTKKLFFQD